MIFDLDGTLVDTVATRIDGWLRALAEFGLPTTAVRLAPLIGIDGRVLAREIAALAGRTLDEEQTEEIDRRSGEIYEGLNHAPRPLPGVRRLVDTLVASDIRWSIATSSRKEQVATSVRALGLATEPTIADASHVTRAKPAPDLLLVAAGQLGVAAAHCWYVGDAAWDMAAAVSAGMIPIGVTAGSGVSADALAGSGAGAVVDSLDAIADALDLRGP